jgi:hypothetical protein
MQEDIEDIVDITETERKELTSFTKTQTKKTQPQNMYIVCNHIWFYLPFQHPTQVQQAWSAVLDGTLDSKERPLPN